jgi:hypothetical protein
MSASSMGVWQMGHLAILTLGGSGAGALTDDLKGLFDEIVRCSEAVDAGGGML